MDARTARDRFEPDPIAMQPSTAPTPATSAAPDYQITVQSVPSRLAMSARLAVPMDRFGPSLAWLLDSVQAHLTQHRAAADGPPFCRHHGAGTDGLRIEAGLPVARTMPRRTLAALDGSGETEILAAELPGGAAAVTWHFGPYDGLRGAYRALGLWLRANQVELASSPWEFYWTSPRDSGDPAAWRTEIVWPLR
jgi:hypothetical protein